MVLLNSIPDFSVFCMKFEHSLRHFLKLLIFFSVFFSGETLESSMSPFNFIGVYETIEISYVVFHKSNPCAHSTFIV